MLVVLVGVFFISLPVFAAKKPTDKERKDRANAEYARCMAVAEKEGVYAALAYIREKQRGTSLAGSPEKLAQENCAADAIGLPRYKNLDEIEEGVGDELVPVRSKLVKIKDDVPQARHCACSGTRDYLIELATYLDITDGSHKVAHSEAQILVASLVRSRADQDRLSTVKKFYRRIKGKIKKFMGGKRSFADCSSRAVCSTHLTGATVDISLLGADKKKRKILYERLKEDREKGRILVILEGVGNHFHVFVIPPQYASLLSPA